MKKTKLLISLAALSVCASLASCTETRGPQGEQGSAGLNGSDGKDGRSVVNIEKTSTNGNVDTYTITFSDKTTSTFTVTNGKDGAQGIQGVPGEDGHTPVITINDEGYWCVDGVSTEIKAKGEKGSDGKDGVSVTKTEIDGNGDLIVTFSDDTTQNAGHVADTTKYTVNYHLGDEIVYTQVVKPYSKISAPDEEYTKGYMVSSWYMMDSKGKADWDFDGYFYRVYENLDLYAEYTANQYTVSFVDKEQGNTMDDMIVTYGSEYELQTIEAGEENVYFLGWYDKDGSAYPLSGKWMTASNVTLYATWTREGYKLTLDPNGGSVSETAVNVAYGKEYSLPAPAREKYAFIGWYDYDDNRVESEGTWSREGSGTLTLTAMWEANAYTYILDPNGGECSQGSISIAWRGSWTLPYPTREDDDSHTYKFAGWYLDEKTKISNQGSGWEYGAGGTLTAKWESTAITKIGSYPQTEVKDEELVSTLNAQTGSLPTSSDSGSWTSYKYYIGSSNDTDFMWYQDVSYEDEKYRAVYFNGSRTYYQSQNGYIAENVYWFKWEPISWRVLSESDGTSLVLSNRILDSQQYYHTASESASVRAPYDSTIEASVYDNNYQYSDIRGWLNTTFYQSSFNDSDKQSIKRTEIDNSASSTGSSTNPFACADTSDRVFLLSSSEASSSSNGLLLDENRIAYPTDYAKCQGAYTYNVTGAYNDGAGWWWLRSPVVNYAYNAGYVNLDGSYWHSDIVSDAYCGVRPALKITI